MSKKNTKGIIIGVVAACAAIGILTPDKKIESIEISLPSYPKEYDINAEVPIDISILPDDANVDSIEYIANSDSITFSDSTLYTGSVEGTYEIYATADNVKSNILMIDVTDISAKIEAAKKIEEERLAREAEEQKAAEEQAAREAEEKAAAEQAAREAEEQAAKEAEEKAAEEQAAKEAKEKSVAEQTVNETAADAPEAEPAPAPQPAEEPAQIAETQSQVVPYDTTAYLSATGKKYHRIKNCGKMNPDKAIETTVSKAEASGHERCSNCW